ncbi:MAG: glycosyltransferase family 39 protein [Planctomycetota bacterium]
MRWMNAASQIPPLSDTGTDGLVLRLQNRPWLRGVAWFCFAALCVFPLFFSLGDHPIHGDSEARYGLAARAMAGGDAPLLVPTLFGEPHLTKPPLTYWLMAGSIRVFGDNEFALRLPSALSGVFTLAIVFGLAYHLCGARRAVIAAAILSVTPIFVVVSRLGITDGLLSLFSTAVLASGLLAVKKRKLIYLLILWISFALALLTKGPPALLAPISLLVWLGVTRQWSELRYIRPILGFLVALMPLALWGILIAIRYPEAWEIWRFQTFDRAIGTGDHPEPWWFFLPVFVVGLLPATALLWHSKSRHIRAAWTQAIDRKDESLLWIVMMVLTLVSFTLITGKLMSYLLPLAAPAAWLASGLLKNIKYDKKINYKKNAFTFSVLVMALAAATYWVRISYGVNEAVGLWPLLLAVVVIGLLGVTGRLRLDAPHFFAPSLAWLLVINLVAWACLAEDRIFGQKSSPVVVEAISQLSGIDEPQIFTVGFSQRNLAYYTDHPTERIDPRILPDKWAKLRKDRLVFLAEPDEWDGFASDPNWDLEKRYELIAAELSLGYENKKVRVYRVRPEHH